MKIETLILDRFPESAGVKTEKTSTSFRDMLQESISKVGEIEKQADQEVEKLAKMETKDIHNTMIAVERADMTFQMMMQVRNKIISAYEEIMRMQV
jgi:flagellar hook-basal body complex protein FliE